MVCPNCHSSDVKRVSLVHAAGGYESRGRTLGFLAASGDALLFGRYRGNNQSQLSMMVAPPAKLPYALPIILWLLGFFVLMAIVTRGKLAWAMGLISVAYIILLPAYLLAALFCNFVLHPRKYRLWEDKFMCQKCGLVLNVRERPEAASAGG